MELKVVLFRPGWLGVPLFVNPQWNWKFSICSYLGRNFNVVNPQWNWKYKRTPLVIAVQSVNPQWNWKESLYTSLHRQHTVVNPQWNWKTEGQVYSILRIPRRYSTRELKKETIINFARRTHVDNDEIDLSPRTIEIYYLHNRSRR